MLNPKEELKAPLMLQKRNGKCSCFRLRICLWVGTLIFFGVIFKLKYRDEDFALLSFSTPKEEKAIGSRVELGRRPFHEHEEQISLMEKNVGVEIGSKSANLAKKLLEELENRHVKDLKIPEKEEVKNLNASGDEVFEKLKKVEAKISGSRKTRSKLSDEEAKKIHDDQYKKSVAAFHKLSEDNMQKLGDAKMQEEEKHPLPDIEEKSIGFLDKGLLGGALDAMEAAGDEGGEGGGGGKLNTAEQLGEKNNVGNTGGLDGTKMVEGSDPTINTGYVERLKRANERMEAELREKAEFADFEDNKSDSAARSRIAAAQAANTAYLASQGVESKKSALAGQLAYGLAQFNPLAG